MVYWSINDTYIVVRIMIVGASKVVKMTIVGDATTWSVFLMTLELVFTIVICF